MRGFHKKETEKIELVAIPGIYIRDWQTLKLYHRPFRQKNVANRNTWLIFADFANGAPQLVRSENG